jgi:hypothetical protein
MSEGETHAPPRDPQELERLLIERQWEGDWGNIDGWQRSNPSVVCGLHRNGKKVCFRQSESGSD